MKRAAAILFAFLLLAGCASPVGNRYVSDVFEAELPETFERVQSADIVCFAPYGDPLLSSSITFCTTELNWYFDSFTESEYESALKALCGYESLQLTDVKDLTVDGNPARRIACRVAIDQGTHDLILYAISYDQTYFFTLLNRDTDSYVDAFDHMMDTLKLKGLSQ